MPSGKLSVARGRKSSSSLKEGKMLHQPRISTLIKRTTLVLLLVLSTGALALGSPLQGPAVTNVSATTSGQSTLLTVTGTSPLPFAVSRPDAHTIVLELPGVDTSRLAKALQVSTPLIETVTVEQGRKPALLVA